MARSKRSATSPTETRASITSLHLNPGSVGKACLLNPDRKRCAMQVEIGVSLPTFVSRPDTIPHIPTLATHVEQVGLDAVWAGDHLCTGAPFMESTIALTAAAA